MCISFDNLFGSLSAWYLSFVYIVSVCANRITHKKLSNKCRGFAESTHSYEIRVFFNIFCFLVEKGDAVLHVALGICEIKMLERRTASMFDYFFFVRYVIYLKSYS